MTDNLNTLADRLEAASGPDNRLDVIIEVAMFDPDGGPYIACRSNAAGTKVVYTDRAGNHETCWAMDYTGDAESRRAAAAALRARSDTNG